MKPGQLLAQLDAQDYVLALDAARPGGCSRDPARPRRRRISSALPSSRRRDFISGAELERREGDRSSRRRRSSTEAQAQVAAQGNQQAYTRLVADVVEHAW